MSENNVDLKQYSPKRFQAHISNLKNDMISPGEALQNAESFFEVKVAEIYSSYEKKLILSNSMDFDDLLIKTVELLQTNDQILHYWSNKFQFVMVDEYQDTNYVQYKLVELLSSNNQNVCVVGDSDQSIYAFRGADIRNIIEFEKDFKNKFAKNHSVIATGSGTDSLHLAFILAGLKKGDEVITTVFTCTATNIPLLHLGPSWGHLGAILGPSWGLLGHLGASWGHLGVILRFGVPFWCFWCPFWCFNCIH